MIGVGGLTKEHLAHKDRWYEKQSSEMTVRGGREVQALFSLIGAEGRR